MPRLQVHLVWLLAICGCAPTSDGGEQSVDVLVPGYETPSSVIYSPHRHGNCTGIAQRSREVLDHKREWKVFRDGYSYLDYDDPGRSYRAFFIPARVEAAPYDAAFVFCKESSTPITAGCSVIGVSPKGCFFSGYDHYKLTEIDGLIGQMRRSYPW